MDLFLHVLNLVLIGCAILVVGGYVMWAVFAVMAFAAWVRDRLPSHRGLNYERYVAEQEIRDIRRRAVRDMLDAEARQRLAYDDSDVIEGTAVAVGGS